VFPLVGAIAAVHRAVRPYVKLRRRPAILGALRQISSGPPSY
jgi:hypothetical protein